MAWWEAPWLDHFLAGWLNYMPLLWGVAIGPLQGRRLAAAFGYPHGAMFARLVELAVALGAFAACAAGLSVLFPGNASAMYGPLIGGFMFVGFGLVEFVRRLGAR